MTSTKDRLWQDLLPYGIFLGVFAGHAVYLCAKEASPAGYFQGQDYWMGFSYAVGAAFAAWAFLNFLRTRERAMAAGMAGSLTYLGVLMAAGCFLTGCCGSPMLGIYLAIFGAKAIGIGKPLIAIVSALSVFAGYLYLSRRAEKLECLETDCGCNTRSPQK